MPQKYIKRILEAKVYDVAIETPLDYARSLSARLDNQVFLKREDLQPVFSFKLRGAYNKIANLSAKQREKGVITVSAGNHAQGVALSAKHLGIKPVIVMPRTTPDIKVSSVRELGGQIVLHGDAYDDAAAKMAELAKEKGMTFIHPYDDPDVIAGQGTIAMEILRQYRDPIDIIFVCVGGGGLIAGISAYIKYLSPKTKIIGVEPDDAASMTAALKHNRRVVLPHVGIFADGAAVKQAGKETFRIAKQCVDDMVVVSSDEMCAAIKDIYQDTRSIAEPAGALGVAGMKKYIASKGIKGKTLIAIDSGANVNFDRLQFIAERAEVGEGREAILAVTIPEAPGSFKRFCQALSRRAITEFNYRFADNKSAQVFVGVQMSDETGERKTLVKELKQQGYAVQDLTKNSLAKTHIRHMVGGHCPFVEDEVVYSFEFPERPNALLNFLNALGHRWNISLFHYRNHGAAFGRVLVGIQVPSNQRNTVKSHFDKLGFSYKEESANAAYQLFLG